jgi:hypothetical protein
MSLNLRKPRIPCHPSRPANTLLGLPLVRGLFVYLRYYSQSNLFLFLVTSDPKGKTSAARQTARRTGTFMESVSVPSVKKPMRPDSKSTAPAFEEGESEMDVDDRKVSDKKKKKPAKTPASSSTTDHSARRLAPIFYASATPDVHLSKFDAADYQNEVFFDLKMKSVASSAAEDGLLVNPFFTPNGLPLSEEPTRVTVRSSLIIFLPVF